MTDHGFFGIVESDRTGFVGVPGILTPVWMPDSSSFLYTRREPGVVRIVERATGGGVEKELVRVPQLTRPVDVSPDGKTLLYRTESELYTVALGGSPEAKPVPVAESVQGRFSPDGRWVVYSAQVNDRTEIYVKPLSSGLPAQITSNGGESPAPIWQGDGKEILYRNRSTIYAVPIEIRGNPVHAGTPQALFKVRVPAGIVGGSMPLAVTRDGSRILFAQGVEQPDPQLTYVMTDWEKALRP